MTNGCIRQTCMKALYFEAINFKKHIKIFERMKIAENVYEGVVEPSY